MPRIIDRQRALTTIGRIRMGERKQPNRPGFQRSTFRFTSTNKAALEKLQKTCGGKIEPWPGNPGQFELDSESGQIRVLLDTQLSVDDGYELYDGKTPCRRCDGVSCNYIELKRDPKDNKKILECIEHGYVPCLCDPEGLGAELDDDDRACGLVTTLQVILPDTDDITLWRFQSKGTIFNREVFGAVSSLEALGIRRGYCLLSINLEEKHRGNTVSKFGVARLTLDPNPPDFVQRLLGNTPEAQARALLAGGGPGAITPPAPQLGQGASSLPAPSPGTSVPTNASESVQTAAKKPAPEERLPLPEDWTATHDEAQRQAKELEAELRWSADRENFAAIKATCADKKLYWPAMVCLAQMMGQATSCASALEWIKAYGAEPEKRSPFDAPVDADAGKGVPVDGQEALI